MMNEIIDLTKELIQFKSIASNPEEIKRCADFIELYLRNNQIESRRISHKNIPTISVLPDSGKVPILLLTHIDVVDGPDEMFEPVEKDGKLYGRGSIDDKYAVALSLVLIKTYVQRYQKQGKTGRDLPFGVVITGDEEVGGYNGARIALSDLEADFGIALDGGSIDEIVVKEKGIFRLKLLADGKAAHGARPWLGENAIEKLLSDYQKIKALFKMDRPDNWHRTINFSMIHAGESANQVPDHAEAIFDIRYTEDDDPEILLREMQNMIDGRLIVQAREPLFFGKTCRHLDLLLELSPETRLGSGHGASDARFFSQYDINGIVWGADGELSQHSSEEHVNIESIYQLFEKLDMFIQKSAAL